MVKNPTILKIKMNNGEIFVLRDDDPFEKIARKFFWDAERNLINTLVEISENKWINPSQITTIEVQQSI